ncbi:MAG TPA: hypothetical protein VLF18_02265 [Tahibacter sp.]|uniref:hypothetical protein n=1 Tax=Tahibacter sp. TaxID=2056211 RepID=UPI002C196070|nr:hypothetical protein [Tahibacter sp.]HSX59001.1 hypothetical protein [Tahibacter sp.]
MATKEETVSALTTVKDGWSYVAISTDTTLRRPIFGNRDAFYFSPVGGELAMTVIDTDGRAVLGTALQLGWNDDVAAFTTTAYGRHMQFRAVRANTPHGWSMSYRAEYEAPPHHHPDEGGDGDPR